MLETSTPEMFGVPLEEHVPYHTTKEGLLIIGDFLNSWKNSSETNQFFIH